MNTKNNRRARNTDEALVRAFYKILEKKKTVSKVTVREICEEAGVNRSTFYAHYLDAYDLLEKVEAQMAQNMTQSFLDKMTAGGHVDECFEAIFTFVKEYREFYAIYLNESKNQGVLQIARELYADRTGDLWEKIGLASPEELAYHEDFYMAGLSAMIRRWVNAGCPESPREMCEILGRQYDPDKTHFIW